MFIAPGIDSAHWKALDLSTPTTQDWKTAISIFNQRLQTRFVDPIDHLVQLDEAVPAVERRFGFTILAVDCLLAETLEAFRRGLTDSRRMSQELCVSFLENRSTFRDYFQNGLAVRFYKEFRCGLAHHGQVFWHWANLVDRTANLAGW
jgi:hypothetical protein